MLFDIQDLKSRSHSVPAKVEETPSPAGDLTEAVRAMRIKLAAMYNNESVWMVPGTISKDD